MTRYILDTDHLSRFQRGDVKVKSRFVHIPPHQIAIAIISAEEQIRGRFAQVRAAKTELARIQAYRWFGETLDILKDFTILPYDPDASARYEFLRQQKLRVGARDLRIAAIALSIGATVVTSNQQDFGQVSGLNLEDWAK